MPTNRYGNKKPTKDGQSRAMRQRMHKAVGVAESQACAQLFHRADRSPQDVASVRPKATSTSCGTSGAKPLHGQPYRSCSNWIDAGSLGSRH